MFPIGSLHGEAHIPTQSRFFTKHLEHASSIAQKRDCRIIAMVPFLCQLVPIQANRQRKGLTAALISDIITFTTKN
jgi:hypothetical protein